MQRRIVKYGIIQSGKVSLMKRLQILFKINYKKPDFILEELSGYRFCQEELNILLLIKRADQQQKKSYIVKIVQVEFQNLEYVQIHLICLQRIIHYSFKLSIEKVIQTVKSCNMEQRQQFDDCFCFDLNIPKVKQIFFLNQHILLVCYLPNNYTIVDIVARQKIEFVKTGKFPTMVEDIKPYKANWIFFVEDNNLHLYDLMSQESISVYSLQKSDIYLQKFKYEYVQEQSLVIFYKISILKSTPITVYYDIHHLSASDKFEKVKKSKVDYQQLRKLSYCQGEVVSFQSSGFEIQIAFITSGIVHKISSIFNLYLVETNIKKDCILLHFTHEELSNELVTYEVTKKKVRKIGRKKRNMEPFVYYNHDQTRSFVYLNFFNHRRGDNLSGIFRIKLTKQSKYLGMLKHLLKQDVGVQFRQTVLDLLI